MSRNINVFASLPTGIKIRVILKPLLKGLDFINTTFQFQFMAIISPHPLSPMDVLRIFTMHGFKVSKNSFKFDCKVKNGFASHLTTHHSYQSKVIIEGISWKYGYCYIRSIGGLWKGDHFALSTKAAGAGNFGDISFNIIHTLSGGEKLLLSNCVGYLDTTGLFGG
jgi:hypothetical protein